MELEETEYKTDRAPNKTLGPTLAPVALVRKVSVATAFFLCMGTNYLVLPKKQ